MASTASGPVLGRQPSGGVILCRDVRSMHVTPSLTCGCHNTVRLFQNCIVTQWLRGYQLTNISTGQLGSSLWEHRGHTMGQHLMRFRGGGEFARLCVQQLLDGLLQHFDAGHVGVEVHLHLGDTPPYPPNLILSGLQASEIHHGLLCTVIDTFPPSGCVHSHTACTTIRSVGSRCRTGTGMCDRLGQTLPGGLVLGSR